MLAILDGIRLALRAIARNPLRASLTVLGILIGVAAVILVTALGSGARDSVGAQIQSLGSNIIFVLPRSSAASGSRGAQGSGVRLSEEDGRAIMRETTSIVALAPALRAAGQMVYGDKNWNTSIIGTTTPYLQVGGWTMERGAMWDTRDEVVKSKVLVLGSSVARELFGNEDPVGRTVRIGRYPYRVLGVLASKGEAPFGGDQDDCALTPIGTFRSRVSRTPPGFAGVLMLSASSPETTDRAVDQIEAILRQRHHIDADRDPDFEIHTQKEFAEIQQTVFGLLTALLIGVAAVSLVVGGIGVMNIMLVSVTERTREIGIRMAIGAREGNIQAQFLIESVVLALIGGLVGTIIAIVVVAGVAKVLGWAMPLDPKPILISIAVSGGIGVGFGFFPARRAAKLDPIEALRHE
ncbi:MAG: ABC transporter permease [Polyangiaceae bacterium]|jgi:putative ABC transport system permease protein